MEQITNAFHSLLDLGGPVILILIGASVLTLALILYKLWQFQAAGVGRHKALGEAVALWDQHQPQAAQAALARSTSYLAPVVALALKGGDPLSERADAEAEARFAKLERGFQALDMVAQLAPLMGLFGTVLGMIEAFRKLQDAGSSVDPSLLAGGIWVALLTTAAGLAVAMPTSLILSWLQARMQKERIFANLALRTVFTPAAQQDTPEAAAPTARVLAHGA